MPRCKHGQSGYGGRPTKAYQAWADMIQRCENPRNQDYKNYGGRGIAVCNRWKNFESFYADLGNCPKDYSLERVNNDGNYCPDNCRWLPKSLQPRNERGKGYRKVKGKYKARISRNYKDYHLGSFKTAEEASERYWAIRNVLNSWDRLALSFKGV